MDHQTRRTLLAALLIAAGIPLGTLLAYKLSGIERLLQDQASAVTAEGPNCLITPEEMPWVSIRNNIVSHGDALWYCEDTADDKHAFCMKMAPTSDCKKLSDAMLLAQQKDEARFARQELERAKREGEDRELRWTAMRDILQTLREFRAEKRKGE